MRRSRLALVEVGRPPLVSPFAAALYQPISMCVYVQRPAVSGADRTWLLTAAENVVVLPAAT
eukprot:354397-Chlamydomonas_euryale.AAC.3